MNYHDHHHHSSDEIVKPVSQNVEESLDSLVQLKDLRHLDISQVFKFKVFSSKSRTKVVNYRKVWITSSSLQCNEAQGVLEPRLVEPSQFLETLVIALTKWAFSDFWNHLRKDLFWGFWWLKWINVAFENFDYVTQLKLFTLDKLSSTIFCCLCLCVSEATVSPEQISTFSVCTGI